MHYSTFLSVLVTTTIVNAAPTTVRLDRGVQIFRRADVEPVEYGPDNDKRAWPLQSVQDAYDALEEHGNKPNQDKPAAGTRYYPRQYGNNRAEPSDPEVAAALAAIPGCEPQDQHKLFEFPLTDPVFSGGAPESQGPDRVIAIAANPGQGQPRSYTYCMAITHRGGTGMGDPSFRPCQSV